MNFLLDTTGNDTTLLIIVAICAIIAIIYHIYKNKTGTSSAVEPNTQSENEEDVTANMSANNDEEIIAVIAAAIAMAESESDGLKFKVVSFRRI